MSKGLGIELFTLPDRHPFNMLEGIKHAMEAEQAMAFMLAKCVRAGAWIDVLCNHYHGDLVKRGVIEEVKEGPQFTYRITEQGKGLLYSHYGKAVVGQQAAAERREGEG